MTETAERLRLAEQDPASAGIFYVSAESQAEHEAALRALLAVVEAAEDVRENSKQAIGMEDPWGSQGPPILVSASMWFELADKLAALHSQASDEEKNG
jgi:hypothetical protein